MSDKSYFIFVFFIYFIIFVSTLICNVVNRFVD
nr:MAG TPA: hypothetical protein [Caudoviricetes sp.]